MFGSVFRAASASTPVSRVFCPWQTAGNHRTFFRSLSTITGFSRSFSSDARSKDIHGLTSQICAVLGAQWGDEGKGKLVDILAQKYDIVARFNGGSNAGHTLKVDGKKFAFHLLPCGMLYKDKINVIGNGVVLHVPTLFKELDNLIAAGMPINGLKISDRAHLLFDFHQLIDGRMESSRGGSAIGTTKRGIGPCYTSKATRNGIRVGELADWDHFVARHTDLCKELQAQFGFEYDIAEEQARYKQYRDKLQPMIIDSVYYINAELARGKRLLAEGANAALLDLDFGTYPYVTSSSTSAGGVATGLGIAPHKIQCHIGIVKAYTTRVGAGPFPTELEDTNGEHMRAVGTEFGTTTGRPRRCGWLDIPVLHFSNILNGYASINITKLDVLTGLKELKIGVAYLIDGKELPKGRMPATLKELAKVTVKYETLPGWTQDISKCTSYSQLPKEAKDYLKRIEELLDLPVSWIGVGAGREAMLLHNSS